MIDHVLMSEDQKVPVKCWTPLIDEVTEKQLRTIAKLPFIKKHVSAMPDAHLGKGSTVGTVIATRHAIIPAAVGVDIGCGMFWMMTDLHIDTIMKHRFDIFNAIERDIPLGMNKHKEKNESWDGFLNPIYANVGDKLETSKYQLGTLGGGNHFIEICTDNQNRISIMLHSGSRGIGNIIAQEHIKTAERLCKEWHIDLPDKELAYLVDSHPEFDRYIHDLHWAQDYAMENRSVMFTHVVNAIQSVVGEFKLVGELVNCHHNYTAMEHHFDEDVWVTRKGAIRARQGDMGIIPGSMGDKSYIVRGKGCVDAFCSAPHGAGRVLSRKKAEEIYTIEDMAKQTEGIVCKKDASVLDEIPRAYKPIEDVIRYSDDLVEVVHEIRQLICVKG